MKIDKHFLIRKCAYQPRFVFCGGDGGGNGLASPEALTQKLVFRKSGD